MILLILILKTNYSPKITSFLVSVEIYLNAIRDLSVLITKAILSFWKSKQTFIEAFIFHHFDLVYYIQVKINAFNYTITGILNKLILNFG